MLDLSERIDIDWITGKPFEDIINGDWNKGKNGSHYLPNIMVRYCTTHLKNENLYLNGGKRRLTRFVEMRIGFRKGEEKKSRKNGKQKLTEDGTEEIKIVIGKHDNGK